MRAAINGHREGVSLVVPCRNLCWSLCFSVDSQVIWKRCLLMSNKVFWSYQIMPDAKDKGWLWRTAEGLYSTEWLGDKMADEIQY